MFNENKAFKLLYNQQVIGVVRVIRPPHQKGRRGKAYLAVFVDKSMRHDEQVQKALYTEVSFAARSMINTNNYGYRIVLPFLPYTANEDLSWRKEPVKQFGSTALPRGSSVLLDEVSGEPLF